MTILFCGGELEDFTVSGTVVFETAAGRYRSAYARGCLDITGGSGSNLTAPFTASSQLSLAFQYYYVSTGTNTIAALRSGGSARLRLKTSGSNLMVEKFDGATATTLATASLTISSGTVHRIDVVVNYSASGSVKVYLNQVLHIDYSGDVTAGGSTTLDSLYLGSPSSVTTSHGWFSEIIASTQDSRSLSLKTLVPNATGDTTDWAASGTAWSDIDDATASESDVVSSGTANQVLTVNATGMPSGVGTVSVVGLKVVASALRGGAGPSKLALGVRTGGSNSFAASATLDYWYPTAIPALSNTWDVNPVTGLAWTPSEIDALQLAFKSET